MQFIHFLVRVINSFCGTHNSPGKTIKYRTIWVRNVFSEKHWRHRFEICKKSERNTYVVSTVLIRRLDFRPANYGAIFFFYQSHFLNFFQFSKCRDISSNWNQTLNQCTFYSSSELHLDISFYRYFSIFLYIFLCVISFQKNWNDDIIYLRNHFLKFLRHPKFWLLYQLSVTIWRAHVYIRHGGQFVTCENPYKHTCMCCIFKNICQIQWFCFSSLFWVITLILLEFTFRTSRNYLSILSSACLLITVASKSWPNTPSLLQTHPIFIPLVVFSISNKTTQK